MEKRIIFPFCGRKANHRKIAKECKRVQSILLPLQIFEKGETALTGRENAPRVCLDVGENNDKTRTRDNHDQVSAWQIKK